MADQKSKIVLELRTCEECPFHFKTPFPTDDSWERPDYYWCKNQGHEQHAKSPDDERTRVQIKEGRKLEKLSYVAGYVEWMDKIPVPDWCPIKVSE